MGSALQVIHWVASFMVLAEALNKLERTAPCAPGLSGHDRLVQWLKAIAWCLLALGAAWIVFTPVMTWLGFSPSCELDGTLREVSAVLVMLGFATLIVRTRVKEG